MVHLRKEAIFNQTVLVERKGGLLLSAAEVGFFTKIIYYWTKMDLQICLKKKKNPHMIKEKSKNQVAGIESVVDFPLPLASLPYL